jgi:hypothetical protein
MTLTFDPAPRSARRAATLLGAAVLLAACGGGAAVSVAPSTVAPAETVAGPSLAATGTPGATLPPAPTVAPTAAPPTALPPATEPPVTAPPPSLAPGIGVKLQIGDEQFMTVVAAEQWPGLGTVKPRKGKAFFTASIQVDAITLTSFDSADFKLRDAAGHSYAWRSGRAPHLYSLDNMSPGGTYTGWITYEIPKTSLGQLTLVYKPVFLVGQTFRVPLF